MRTAPGWICTAYGLAIALVAAVMLSQPPLKVASQQILDDAFYYLQIAWNHRHLGFPTFDGVSATNGFHVLWYLILYALSFLCEDKITFLRAALGVAALLNCLSLVWIYRIGKTLRSDGFAVVGGALWLVLATRDRNVWQGLETSLVLFLMWWFLWRFLQLWLREADEPASAIPAAIPAALAVLARLDTLIVTGVMLLILVIHPRTRGSLRGVIPALSLIAFATVLYGLLMLRWGGTVLPISALVKALAMPNPRGLLSVVRGVASNSIPRLGTPGITLILLAITAALAFAGPAHKRRLGPLLPLASAVLVYMTLLVVMPRNGTGPWYFTSVLMLTVCFVGLVWGDRFKSRGLLIYVFPFVAAAFTLHGLSQTLKPTTGTTRIELRPVASQWIDQNLPQEAVLAAWNAGQLGYLSNRRLINLDGLVNNREYYETVLHGKIPLSTYLKNQGVTHLIDITDPTLDKTTRRLPIVKQWGSAKRPLTLFDASGADREWQGGWYPKR